MPPVTEPPMPVFGVDGVDWFVAGGAFGSEGWSTLPDVPGVLPRRGVEDVVPGVVVPTLLCASAGPATSSALAAVSARPLKKCILDPPESSRRSRVARRVPAAGVTSWG